jgi:death-on-curing family protein
VAREEYRDHGLVSSAAARPFQSAGGKDIYETIPEKAAALFHSLVANHPFHNGNKRTAVIAADHFLLANSYLLAMTPAQMYRLAKKAASYRERGTTHDAIFAQIVDAIGVECLPLSLLRNDAGLKALYQEATAARRDIRWHELNREPGVGLLSDLL